MKLTERRLRKIIREEIQTITEYPISKRVLNNIPHMAHSLWNMYGDDPLYKKVLTANNEAEIERALDALKQIRGDSAYRNFIKVVTSERLQEYAGKYKGDPRIITVKYPTTCDETGKPLRKGDEAVYYPNGKKLYALDSRQGREFQSWKMDVDGLGRPW